MAGMNRRSLLLTLPLAACGDFLHGELGEFHATTLAGERFDNERLRGRPMLVQMWTTWCGYCRGEQPAVDAVERDYGAGGVVVLAVNIGETRSTVTEYLRSSPRRARVVLETDTNLVSLFGRHGVPYYAMVRGDGRIAGELRGAHGEQALRQLVERGIRS